MPVANRNLFGRLAGTAFAMRGWASTLALTASLLLSGCSVLPGMSFKGSTPSDDQWVGISNRYHVEAITPELLSAQAEARQHSHLGRANFVLQRQIETYQYKVGPQDVLSIVLWGDPTKTAVFTPMSAPGAAQNSTPAAAGFKVNTDGTIYFPYVGKVPVAGKTTEEIRALLARRMRPYVQDPQITVDVAQFASQQFQIAGVVAKPGLYPITDKPLTVSQAISAAGGVVHQGQAIAATANIIARPLGDLSRVLYVHDHKVALLNLHDLQQYGDETQDRLVYPDDVIQVPDNSFEQIHVIGEVKTPGNYSLNNDSLSLSQALGDAGSIDVETADTARIFIFRGAYQEPHIYWLDASSPDAMLLANDFKLEPQDVVYVASAGLADWNRIISQILPTVQTLYFTKALVK